MLKLMLLVLLTAVPVLGAYEVDSDELAPYIDSPIEFQNYEGPLEVVQTRDEILGIGLHLGEQFTPEFGQFSYFGVYTVIHAVDPTLTEGLDADIMLLSDRARVDHINNFRLIIAGYLQGAYEYLEDDAALLAEYITIYNAVFRNELEFFEQRYKPVVLQHLTEESVGLSTHYSDWPGGTELVIPLTDGTRPGDLAAVSPFALLDPEVREQLRTRDNRGIATRKAMVEFLERVLAERIEELDRAVERLDRDRDELTRREDELVAELRKLEERRAAEDLSDAMLERIAEIERELAEVEERELELEERAEEVAERQDEVDDLTDLVREEREAIAEDTREMLDLEEQVAALIDEPEDEPVEEPEPPEESWFILMDDDDRGRLVRIAAESGDPLGEVTGLQAVWGRKFKTIGDHAVVIADNEGRTRLARVTPDEREVIAQSDFEISRRSELVLHAQENRFYAVTRYDDEWYLGRFDRDLRLTARSAEAVRPDTAIMVSDTRVYVQAPDDRVLALDLVELESMQ